MSVNQTHTKTSREMFWATGVRYLRGRTSFASLPTGPSDFSGPHIVGFPDNRPCIVCGAAPQEYMHLEQLKCVWAAKCFKYANWRFGCKLAIDCELAFWLRICVWAANWLLGCKLTSAANLRLGCKLALNFVQEKAIRTFRRRTSYVFLTTGPAEFAGYTSIASLRTGP